MKIQKISVSSLAFQNGKGERKYRKESSQLNQQRRFASYRLKAEVLQQKMEEKAKSR